MTEPVTSRLPLHQPAAPSTRLGMPGWWHLARAQRRLAAARRAVPAVLAEVGSAVPAASEWRPSPGTWTGTGTAVFHLGGAGDPAAVLRMSTQSGARLRHETAVLQHLGQLALPAPVRALLPRCLAAGSVEGFEYVVDAALPGRSADLLVAQPRWSALQVQALAAIREVHRATARETRVDEDLLRRWIDEPLAVVSGICARLPGVTRPSRLARLRGLLRDELAGRRVLASLVHGDFWAGNLLADADGITGIVDWDLAASDELPSHDHLHLLLYAERDLTGRELGDIVSRLAAADRPWTDAESRVLDACSWAFPDGPPSARALVLLHWLRHVAAISVQQRSYVTHSVRVWELRNVHRVLRSL